MLARKQREIVEMVSSEEDFATLKSSGMFWEWFPECDGTYENSVELYKQGEKK